MRTKYKYLIFEQVPHKSKTTFWECKNSNSGTVLGVVKWYGAWRQYCYFPTVQAVYSAGCLQDIENFMGQLRQVAADAI